jgi:GntR family transcriptional regulator
MTSQQINRRSKVPYYHQLYEILYEKIKTGEWKPGDQIPAEPELIDTYQVSRSTVRNVLDMLVNKGLIYRQRGRGTFVSQPSVEQALVRIVNFTEDMRQRGITPSSKVLSSEVLPASAYVADQLQVPIGEELACLRRLRLGNNEPMGLEESFLVHHFCPGILTRHDFSGYSLRETIYQDYGIEWLRASQIIRAVNASSEMAKLLEVENRAALLSIERVTYSKVDTPVEFLRIYYRGDRYSLYNELQE